MTPPIIPPETLEVNREMILNAAEDRYRDVGYDKTTMAEIASDVGMSAANLYRYFKNKHEIGCACAERCMFERIDALREVVEEPGLTATDKLRKYALVSFEVLFEASGQDAKLDGLVQQILKEHKDLVRKKVEHQTELIKQILAQGIEQGEFQEMDCDKAAQGIQTALVLFDVPIFMSLYSYDEFQERVNGVIDLILIGLNTRK